MCSSDLLKRGWRGAERASRVHADLQCAIASFGDFLGPWFEDMLLHQMTGRKSGCKSELYRRRRCRVGKRCQGGDDAGSGQKQLTSIPHDGLHQCDCLPQGKAISKCRRVNGEAVTLQFQPACLSRDLLR